MDTLVNIMWIGILVMVIGTIYIFWKNRDIFSY
jgi:hypothetical protein